MVNKRTYWDQLSGCHLAGSMGQIIKRVPGLRDKFGTGRRILIQNLDVKIPTLTGESGPSRQRDPAGTTADQNGIIWPDICWEITEGAWGWWGGRWEGCGGFYS